MNGPEPLRRVALVSSSYLPHPGGVEQHVRSVAGALSERGHQVVIWTVDRGEHLGVQLVDGVEVHYLPTPLPARSVGSILRFLLWFPAAATAWWRAFRSFRPDVLHVQCFGPNGLYAAALSWLTGKPLVVSTHGETFADDHGVFEKSALLRAGMRWSLASAAAVTGCSQVVLDDLRLRFGFNGGRVVPNGIDLEHPRRVGDRLPPGTVFAVGRLERMKGFDLLLEAFAEAKLPPGAGLVIGGDGALAGPLQKRIEELGLEHRVRLLGRLHADEVSGLMETAAAVVVPSRREAFGLVVLEAWRAGAPLIATSRGGPATIVEDNVTGLVVDPEDTAALARALEIVLQDAATAERIGRGGREAVRAYPWKRVAELYEDCYVACGPR